MVSFRVTQTMLVSRSLDSLQLGMQRVAAVQEQLSTGRMLNRPSDSPTDTTSAMRMRSSLADTQQFQRNASDGLGRLELIDQTLSGVTDQVRRARELALQGANTGSSSTAAGAALATEIDQLRTSLIADANTAYLERPVFGGITAGSRAYDDGGTFVGVAGEITRRVGTDVRVRVDVTGTEVFGPDGDSLFDDLTKVANALRSGDDAGIQGGIQALADRLEHIGSVQATVGARTAQIERALQSAQDNELSLTSALSDIENIDLPKVMVDLNLQQVAYQAALASTARVLQPSLNDFLR